MLFYKIVVNLRIIRGNITFSYKRKPIMVDMYMKNKWKKKNIEN